MEFAGLIQLVRALPSQPDRRAEWSSADLQVTQKSEKKKKKKRITLQHPNGNRRVKQKQRVGVLDTRLEATVAERQGGHRLFVFFKKR